VRWRTEPEEEMRIVGRAGHKLGTLRLQLLSRLLVPRVFRRLHLRVELGEARALFRRERLRCLRRLRQLVLVRLDALAPPPDRLMNHHALGVRVEDVGAADVLAAALQQHLADRLVLVAVGLKPGLNGAAEFVARVHAAVGVGLADPCHLGVVPPLVRDLPVIIHLRAILVAEVREADQLARLAQAIKVDAQQQVLGVRVLQVGQLLRRGDGGVEVGRRHQKGRQAIDLLPQLGDPRARRLRGVRGRAAEEVGGAAVH